jgi:phosphoribosylamine--glycine ligase
MKVLVLGSGGREHVLVNRLSQEIGVENVFAAPGNGGTDLCAKNVAISPLDFEAVGDFCIKQGITHILPGNEDPLVNGLRDFFESRENLKGVYIFGPDQKGAQLEGSKAFAKAFMHKYQIPTAKYKSFSEDDIEGAMNWLPVLDPPYVLKADGLAAGKGVLICDDINEAETELEHMLLDRKFGEASSKVVIEEFLNGIEFSVFIATDGENYCLLPEAKDYKRIGEGDKGLNTGGMGAVSPVPFVDQNLMQKVVDRIIEPTLAGLRLEKIDYRGFIFFGLMNVGGDPYVIEYNVRMGDPETEVVFPRINGRLSDMLELSAKKELHAWKRSISRDSCTTVFTVSKGYPEAYEKGKLIQLPEAPQDGIYFHAGTKRENHEFYTSGGRVIACTFLSDNLTEALEGSYQMAEALQFEGKVYRKDIGLDVSEPD